VLATFPFLPEGWEQRLRDLEVDGLRARCLEVHDLVLSKLAAGRLKDNELIASLIQHGLIEVETVRARIAAVADLHMRAVLLARLQIVLESGER
jgi:predicted nucleotidyltransferase